MKATGIVRKLDDLGRIVVPKEICRVMGISKKDPIEFYVENDCVVLKKYDAAGDMAQLLDKVESEIEMLATLLSDDRYNALMEKVSEMKAIVRE